MYIHKMKYYTTLGYTKKNLRNSKYFRLDKYSRRAYRAAEDSETVEDQHYYRCLFSSAGTFL